MKKIKMRGVQMKKLQIALLVFVMVFIVAVSGCTSTTSNTSNSSSSQNTSSSNASASNDISIVINYSGSWACDVSGPFGYRSLSGTGNQTTNIGAVTESVTAAARKTDGGTETLTVTIKKGDQVLASQSTNAPYGGASATAVGF